MTSILTLTLTFDFDFEKFTKVNIFETSIKENEPKGQGHGWSKGQICLIGYNFWSNCHRNFKLGSYFS